MTKQQYIEQHGYISNKDFKTAQEIKRDYNINIQDWQLPKHKLLNEKIIKLMIELRLHIKHNVIKNFKNNFYRFDVLPRNKGIEAVNYTGHVLCYNGTKFFGDYKFCVKFNNKINTENEELYIIDGMYPIYSITSLLQEDIERVKNTNPSWWNKEITPIKIEAYNK